MATLDWFTGFEYGLVNVNGGGLCDGISGSVGTEVAIVSSPKHSGNYALRVAPTASTAGRWYKNYSGAPTGTALSFWIYIESAPSTAMYIATVVTGTATAYPFLYLNPSTGNFELRRGTSTVIAVGPAYQVGVWTRVDWKVDVSADPWSMYAKIDEGTEFGGTAAVAADTLTRFSLGTTVTSGPAYSVVFDDIVRSVTVADYPLGDMRVVGLRPNADGTHNNAANIMEDSAGNDIDGSTYYAYDKLEDAPWGSGAASDYVRQTANGTGNYCEIQFADTVRTGIVAAIGLLQYASATATGNRGACIIRSNTTETTLWGNPTTTADYSESSVFHKFCLISPDGGSWSTSIVNALRCRFGYSDDAAPDPYWLAIMLEVVYLVPSLTVQDAYCTTQSDNVDVTTGGAGTNLVVQDAYCTSQADNVVTTKQSTLAVQDAYCVTQSDNVVTTKQSALVVQDAYCTSQVDAIAVTKVVTLVVQDAYCTSQSDNVVTSKQSTLIVQDAFCTSQSDNVVTTKQSTLVVQDAYCTSQTDAIAVTKQSTLVVQDAYCSTQADAVAITQVHNLVVQDAFCQTQVDSMNLAGAADLSVQDAHVTTQVDGVVIAQVYNLVVQDAYCTSQADNVVTTKESTLSVDDSYCSSQSDNVVLELASRARVTWIQFEIPEAVVGELVVQDGFSTTQVDSVALTQVHNLVVQDAHCTTQTDNVATTKSTTLVVQDASCDTQADSIQLSQVHNLTVQDAYCTSQVDDVVVTGPGALTIQDAYCTSQVDGVVLTQVHNLVVQDAYCTSQVDAVVVATEATLVVQDAACDTQTDSVNLTQTHNLVVTDAYCTSQVDSIVITGPGALTIQDASCGTQVDAVALTQVHNLVVQDAYCTTQTDSVATTITYVLAVNDAHCVSQVDAAILTQIHNLIVADAYCTTQVDIPNVYTALIALIVITMAAGRAMSSAFSTRTAGGNFEGRSTTTSFKIRSAAEELEQKRIDVELEEVDL